MSTIHVALVTNALGPPTRGNGTTVHRWLGWLPDVDVHVTPVYPGFGIPEGRRPDLVHGYHALHGGLHARRLAERHELPLMISLGGTDLHDLKLERANAADVRAVLAAAVLVTGAFPSFGEELQRLEAGPGAYAVVPRGVYVPDAPPAARDDAELRILLPAGLRPVKDPLLGLTLFSRLREAGLPARLRIAGPSLDAEYGARVHAVLAEHPGAEILERNREDMPAEYAAAHVVWNTSLHEGGANALLEGLAFGCAVYARDVPGNHDLLAGAGAPGRLFDDAHDLIAFHRALLQESPEERTRRTTYARQWLRREHDSAAEARALRAAYERVLSA